MRKILCLTIIAGLVLCRFSFAVEFIQNGVKKEYYPNGKVKAEIIYKDGKPNGPATTYYENGKKDSEIAYQEGIPVGRGIFYFEDGNLKEEIAYFDGLNDMKIRNYYLNKNLYLASRKKNGKWVETTQEYAPNGQLLKEIRFDENGGIKEEKVYGSDGNSFKDGILVQYHPNGKASMETPYRDGQTNGMGKQYNEEGRAVAEIFYKDGKEISRKEYDKK